MMTASTDQPRTCTSALLAGADWALAHNDMASMSYFVDLLASRASEPLRDDAHALARLLELDVDRAARRWPLLRARLWEELGDAHATR
jgi:hypothetical protein